MLNNLKLAQHARILFDNLSTVHPFILQEFRIPLGEILHFLSLSLYFSLPLSVFESELIQLE